MLSYFIIIFCVLTKSHSPKRRVIADLNIRSIRDLRFSWWWILSRGPLGFDAVKFCGRILTFRSTTLYVPPKRWCPTTILYSVTTQRNSNISYNICYIVAIPIACNTAYIDIILLDNYTGYLETNLTAHTRFNRDIINAEPLLGADSILTACNTDYRGVILHEYYTVLCKSQIT
jgi:hypothetical protein